MEAKNIFTSDPEGYEGDDAEGRPQHPGGDFDDDQVVTSHELKELLSKTGSAPNSFKTGVGTLDSLMGGVEAGELIIVSGPTKMGKTLLCQTITANLARDHRHALWFSYELGPRQFLDRFGPVLPHFYIPKAMRESTIGWIQMRCLEALRKYERLDAVFIDHLHFLVDLEKLRRPDLEIGSIVRALKRNLAIPLGIAVFLIAHIRKVPLEKELDTDDLRDSSFVAQDADATVMVWRLLKEKGSKEYGDMCWVKVCNHRRTGVMGAGFRMKKVEAYLVEDFMQPSESAVNSRPPNLPYREDE